MTWEKQPAIEGKDIHVGCLCCSTACRIAPLNMPICVGFGSAFVTKNGEMFYDGEKALQDEVEPLTVGDIEQMARNDPDNDWRIVKHGPMHGETFQRHGDDAWVCIESNAGFS